MVKKEEKKKEEKSIENSERKAIKRSINRVAETKDGQVFINYLMKICGFATSSLVINPTSDEINSKSTIYHEARKTVYYHLRGLIDKENLKEIEYMQNKEDAENDN